MTSLFITEEVLSADFALWWSGDSQRLLFASFNDTLVGIFEFPIYGPPEDQYTDIEAISYPKVSFVIQWYCTVQTHTHKSLALWSCDICLQSCDAWLYSHVIPDL